MLFEGALSIFYICKYHFGHMLKKHECSITQKISVTNAIVEMHDSSDIIHLIWNLSAGAIVSLNVQGFSCHLPPVFFLAVQNSTKHVVMLLDIAYRCLL